MRLARMGGPMSKLVKSKFIDLETHGAVHAVISGYRPDDIIPTAIAVDEVRQKFPECSSDDKELVGLLLLSVSGQNIAVSLSSARLLSRRPLCSLKA